MNILGFCGSLQCKCDTGSPRLACETGFALRCINCNRWVDINAAFSAAMKCADPLWGAFKLSRARSGERGCRVRMWILCRWIFLSPSSSSPSICQGWDCIAQSGWRWYKDKSQCARSDNSCGLCDASVIDENFRKWQRREAAGQG